MKSLMVLLVFLGPPLSVGPSGVQPDDGLARPFDSRFDGCIDCGGCGDNFHYTNDEAPLPTYSLWPDQSLHPYLQCFPGTCLVHGICGGDDQEDMAAQPSVASELEAVRQAVASGDAEVLSDVLRTASPRVKLSTERSAIQVSGCGGEIVAHFPLPAATIETLTHPSH